MFIKSFYRLSSFHPLVKQAPVEYKPFFRRKAEISRLRWSTIYWIDYLEYPTENSVGVRVTYFYASLH